MFSGVTATVVDYGVYELLVTFVFKSAEGAAAAISIAGAVGIVAAYLLHSRLTWRERDPGRFGVVKFVLWNLLIMVGLRPIIVGVMGWFGWLYEWFYGVCVWLGLPFGHDFVVSTAIYVLTTVITATLNYFFYDWVVFDEKNGKTGKAGKAGSSKRKVGAGRDKSVKR